MKNATKQRLQEVFHPSVESVRAYETERHLRLFCNTTSEELSTMLGAIIGEVEHVLSMKDETQFKEALQLVIEGAERAQFLARNLRYFAVHTRLATDFVDVSQTVLNTIDIIEKDFKTAKIEMAAFIESGVISRTDAGALQQILLNFLHYAQSSMPAGGKLSLSLTRLKDSFEITVSDTGKGIAVQQLDQVFEPYANSKGLGLAVAKALIEAQGGDVVVKSTLGKGTNFIFHLPLNSSGLKANHYLEKRRFRRVNLTLPVEIDLENQPPIHTSLTILSTGGCFVKLPNLESNLKKDDHVRLRIFYTDKRSIEINRGRIANISQKSGMTGIGIEFTEVSAKAGRVVASLVRSHGT